MKNENYSDENYDRIVGRLRHLGLPEIHDKSIQEQMKEGVSRILPEYHNKEYAGNVMVIPHIEKSTNGDYYANRLQVRLQKKGSQYYRQQYFPIHSLKEFDTTREMAINLLRGSYVLKDWPSEDGQTAINEWRTLGRERTSAGYDYITYERDALDVAAKLGGLPILEGDKNYPNRTAVILSIESGNSQGVHLDAPGTPYISLRANPVNGDLDVISKGHMISKEQVFEMVEQLRDKGQSQGNQPSIETGAAQEQKDEKGINTTGEGIGRGTAGTEGQMGPSNALDTGVSGNNKQDRTNRVLTGNPITPNPSNSNKNSMRMG